MSTHIVSPLEATVEKHVASTSQLVRRVELAFSILIVSSLIFGVLFLAVLADHWFLKDGLTMSLRFVIFAALLAAAGAYIYWKIVPFFRYTINPVYTADLIERGAPAFKNSLINWLLLRQERDERDNVPTEKIDDRMFTGVVRTAAGHLQTVPVGHAVDYRKLIWVGSFLTVLLLSFIVYAWFSPKSSAQTFIRIVLPFSGVERPQAVQFRNVQPGDATALQGETLVISAEVISQSPEPVHLVFSTDDGQAFEQRIPMSRPEGKIAFETPSFPPGRQGTERGFNSSVDYWIMQGESRSKQYRIDVLPAASMEIVSLRYDFPAYTGLEPEIIEHGGDIRALEGTTVTVEVRSTLPLQESFIVFDDNPANRVKMTVDEQKTGAKGTIALKHPYSHKTFAFQATDANGNPSRRSGIYRIEVIPDQPPKVQWADTATHLRDDRINLPLNETLPMPIQAEDPDFALRHLRFKTESPGKRIPDVALLESPATGPTNHRGQISKTVAFSPADKRLAVGDTAEIWAEAIDTKLPEANVSTTRKITIQVVAPVEKKDETQQDQEEQKNGEGDKGEGEKGEGQDGDKPNEGGGDKPNDGGGDKPNDGGGDKPNNGGGDKPNEGGGDKLNEGGGDKPGEGKRGDKQEEQKYGPSPNPETQPGEAMERILDQMKADGKIDENGNPPQAQGTGQRERGDLDPDSPDRVEAGTDPSNPKQAPGQIPTGNEPGQGDGQPQPGQGDGQPQPGQGDGQPQPGQQGNTPGQQGDTPGQQGDTPGQQGDTPGQRGDTPGQQGDTPGQRGDTPGQQGDTPGRPQGGTQPGDNPNGPLAPGESTGEGEGIERRTTPDDHNLEYAEKVTNLILEYLEDQLKDKPNEDLLRRLDWNEEQLRQFHAIWKDMAEKSKQPQQQENGTDFWKEALKSTGLHPNRNRAALQQNQTTIQDDKREMEAQRWTIPSALMQRYQRYNNGIGRQ